MYGCEGREQSKIEHKLTTLKQQAGRKVESKKRGQKAKREKKEGKERKKKKQKKSKLPSTESNTE